MQVRATTRDDNEAKRDSARCLVVGSQVLPRGGAVVVAIALVVAVATMKTGVSQTHTDSAPGQVGLVRVDTTRVINSFDPDSALGSSIDVLSRMDINKVFTPHIVQEALSAGWGPITYRNNTELRMAAWHWTENGTWSDAAHRSGYFTGSTELKDPIKYISPTLFPIAVSRPAAIVQYPART